MVIELVMDSLRYIRKILGENDRYSYKIYNRIAIVIFQSYALINLKWTRNTTQNKLEIKNAILNKKTKGSSNIANGVKLGLKMIKERKYKNPVTYMFVFSNG